MQNSAPADDKIYFLIDQPESAGQTNANALLARDVYRNIANFIDEALGVARQARQSPDPMHHRYHNTVLIDGDRGTGKSTVLVNLACYLKAYNEETLSQVHICAPVDPTLLEDHDDLFLNVILAAVLSDKKVEEAQQRNPSGRQALAKQLQKLGSALEHMQNQREHTQKGMDKLRAFVGNQQLIQEVHDFFTEVLKLLDKKLLILTIDDVDTGLDKAFENLEVVRRYLTSPYVMPIISGDLSLYHEVIWRKFHSKLLKDSDAEQHKALELAQSLAYEYQRKLIPNQYRQKMPPLSSHLENDDILILLTGKQSVSLKGFFEWMLLMINGTANGVGLDVRRVPLRSIRAMSQFLRGVRSLIPSLSIILDGNSTSKQDVFLCLRNMLLEDSGQAYKVIGEWARQLLIYFLHEKHSAIECLVLDAISNWCIDRTQPLDVALFRPELHERFHENLKQELRSIEWEMDPGRVPSSRWQLLPQEMFFDWPLIEMGVPFSGASNFFFSKDDVSCCDVVNVFNALMLSREFYSETARAIQCYTGRVFELVVISVIRDVSIEDFWRVMRQAPYNSIPTYNDSRPFFEQDSAEQSKHRVSGVDDGIALIVSAINNWRAANDLDEFFVFPWIVLGAAKRFFAQEPYWTAKELKLVKCDNYDVFFLFGRAFFEVWSAFACVEKGGFFGGSSKISGDRLPADGKYMSSVPYVENIKGLVTSDFSSNLKPVALYLESHPFKHAMDASFVIKGLEPDGISVYDFECDSLLEGGFVDTLMYVNKTDGAGGSVRYLMNYFKLEMEEVEGLDEDGFLELFRRDGFDYEVARYFLEVFAGDFPGSRFYAPMSVAIEFLD